MMMIYNNHKTFLNMGADKNDGGWNRPAWRGGGINYWFGEREPAKEGVAGQKKEEGVGEDRIKDYHGGDKGEGGGCGTF